MLKLMKLFKSKTKRTNPFNTRPGMLPVVFEGRDSEIRTLKEAIEGLGSEEPNPTLIILYGPRGNGKTTLLSHILKHTKSINKELKTTNEVTTIYATPSQCAVENLYQKITGGQMHIESTKSESVKGGVKAIVQGEVAGASIKVYGSPASDYYEVLKRATEDQPTLLCIDEAHTMGVNDLRDLFQCAQQCLMERLPISIVLAGTPGLITTIGASGATFAPRYDVITLGRLNTESARRVFEEPLKSDHQEVPAQQLKEVIEKAQNYPFFLQIYGRETWERCVADGQSIESQDVWKEIHEAFEVRKTRMYYERYTEMESTGTLDIAYEISMLFEKQDQIQEGWLIDKLRTDGYENVNENVQALKSLGYVWGPGGSPGYLERGIPSLMDYVRTYTEDRRNN